MINERTARRALIMIALAGLFVVETLFLEPTLFDTYIAIEIAPNTEVQIQKSAVQTLLPKGTLKGL